MGLGGTSHHALRDLMILSTVGRMVGPRSPDIYSEPLFCAHRVLGGAGDRVATETILALPSWDSQSSGGTDLSVDSEDSEWAGQGIPEGALTLSGKRGVPGQGGGVCEDRAGRSALLSASSVLGPPESGPPRGPPGGVTSAPECVVAEGDGVSRERAWAAGG